MGDVVAEMYAWLTLPMTELHHYGKQALDALGGTADERERDAGGLVGKAGRIIIYAW